MPGLSRSSLLLATIAFPLISRAEAPRPDRPMLSRTGQLVSGLELEGGGAWSNGAFGAPVRMKAGFRIMEPRLGLNLAGVGSGAPGLAAGLKLGLVQESSLGLAGYLESAIPLSQAEAWSGEAGGALTARTGEGLELRFNAAALFLGDGAGASLVGVPLRGMVGVPVGDRWQPFGEAEAILGGGGTAWRIAAGLGWSPAEALVADLAAGWDLGQRAPMLQAGLTANLGRLR